MSSVRLGKEHYTELLEYLKTFLPKTLMIYSLVRRLERGIFKDFIVWVDRWPRPEAVVANADLDICKIPCWRIFVVAFDKNPASFMSLFLEVDKTALYNNLPRAFPGLTQETVELLNEIFPNRQYPMKSPEFMWLKHRDNLKVNDSILPDGFYAGAMTQALSEVVVEQATEWRGYLEPVAIYNAATIYDCPYAAVFDKDNVPVGWFVQHCVLRSLNHLFVLPEFRGKGIGKFLIEQASKGALEMDGYAFIQVDTENTLSKKIHKNAGFEMGETLIPYLLLPR